MAPRYISYARFSTSEQGKVGKDSLRRQIASAERWAASRNVTIDERLTDEGVPGFRGKNSTEGALYDFLQAIEAGIIKKGDYLLIERLDRLTRMEPVKATDLVRRIIEQGVTIVVTQDNMEYSSESLTKFGNFSRLAMQIELAHFESRQKSDRVGDAWTGTRLAAQDGGPKRRHKHPAWIRWNPKTRDYELIEDRAETVRIIYQLYTTGEATGSLAIAKRLTELGRPCFGNKKQWLSVYVQKILKERTTVGEVQFYRYVIVDGRKVHQPVGQPIPGYYPAAVDEETWSQAARLRQDKAFCSTGARLDEVPNLFTNKVFCCDCGATMHILMSQRKLASGKTREYRYYRCSENKFGGNCEASSTWPKDRFEKTILNFIAHELSDVMIKDDAASRSKITQSLKEVEALEAKMNELKSIEANLVESLCVTSLPNAKRAIEARLEQAARESAKAEEAWSEAKNTMKTKHEAMRAAGAAVEEIDRLLDTGSDRKRLRAAVVTLIDKVVLKAESKEADVHFKTGLVRTVRDLNWRYFPVLMKTGHKAEPAYVTQDRR